MAMSVVYATVNGRLVQENRGGNITRYVADTLGSVIQTRDASGNQTSSTIYWPFGEVRTSSGTNPSPWGFCGIWGYYTDSPERIYILERIYLAHASRWLSVDSLWPEESAYGYAYGDPIRFFDPTGCAPCSLEPPDKKEGKGSCYSFDEGFKNCCTACGKCFTKKQECSNGVAALPDSGFKCGDLITCCLKSDSKKCWDFEITDTGSGRSGRIIDIGCCFATNNGIMKSPGLVDLVCWKTGTTKVKRSCKEHSDCAANGDRGKYCKDKKKKKPKKGQVAL